MTDFLQRVENEIQDRRLFMRGQKILVAVSGGVDSMVLLHVLHSLAPKNRWQICVAHFNHQLRGRASVADENLVWRTAEKLRLKFCGDRADVKKIARQSKISVEMTARKLRHEFLARMAKDQKISVVALAHHADDQVELFFLRLLRGAGGEGLAGMKWRAASPADKKIMLVRPLLGISKAEILAFARTHKIPFRDDATNFSSDFLRNRIRNELLPLLQSRYQPGLTKTVLRLMEITGSEAKFADESARQWLEVKKRNRFERLSLAVQRKVLQRQLVERGVVSDFELVEQLRLRAGKFVSVSPDLSVARDAAGKVQLLDLNGRVEKKFRADEFRLKLQGRAGRASFGVMKFRWRIQPQNQFVLPERLAGAEFFDADKIGVEIVLRHWRAGDRFQPIGLRSAVKLQDLFMNAKIPAAWRRELVLAATPAGEIFWVEGLRIAEKFKLTPETRRKLAWNWSKFAR